MSSSTIAKPRPLWRVLLLSGATLLLYYGYYKWVIQDELRRYRGSGWSGAFCLLPFVLGVSIPLALRLWDPDVPGWFGWLSLLGVIWIYIVQFRLYRAVNTLYREAGMKEPLVVWWLFVPGLNLVVGLRQIHFLSQFWAKQQGNEQPDPLAQALPLLFASVLLLVMSPTPAIAAPGPFPTAIVSPTVASLFSFSGTRPTHLGVHSGELAPCPSTPNCVTSFSTDRAHSIEPLTVRSAPEQAFQQLKAIVASQPRAKIISATDDYLYAEFTSAIMGFVDDVEFYFDRAANVVQVRSASRLGESDLGVNRQRIEAIRARFAA